MVSTPGKHNHCAAKDKGTEPTIDLFELLMAEAPQ